MLGFAKKVSTVGELRRVTGTHPVHAPGTILQVTNGKVPAEIKAITEAVAPDEAIDSGRVRVIDSALFEIHSRPVRPRQPELKPLERADLRKRFNWSDSQIDVAGTLGLKSALIAVDRVADSAPRLVRRWRAVDVDTWEERVRSLKL